MPNKLNVLVIPAWYDIANPFAGIFFHEYCNALSKKCNIVLLNVNVFPYSQRGIKIIKKDSHLLRAYELVTIDHYNKIPGKAMSLFSFIDRCAVINKTKEVLEKLQSSTSKFDLIHIQSVCNNITPIVAYSLSKQFNIPYILTEHYTSFKEAGERIFKPFLTSSIIKQIVNNAYARYAVSSFACDYYKELFDCQFDLVPNLIPDSFINSQTLKKRSTKDSFTFICIGSFQIRKGQLVLLEAFSKINGNNKLILIGGGPDKQKMMSVINALNIENKVVIIDKLPKEEIVKFIDESDILISASERETFGLTIIEAFFRGKPVISTRSGGPQDLINNSNGLLCEVGNASDLSEKMNFMMKNFESYDPEKIKNDAVNRYSENVISELMLTNYKNIIQLKAAGV